MSAPIPASPVPMFPLPGLFLYPTQLLPLHIFEPRYRQMIGDSLDGHGRIVMGTILGDGEPPPVMPVAGLGEIVRHEKLPDGRYHVWLLGLGRVQIQEVESDRLYRKVRCLPFEEVPASNEDARELKALLRDATQSRVRRNLSIPSATPTNMLTDLLMQTIQAPPAVVEAIFAETSVAERARKALAAHAHYPKPPQPDDLAEDR
jgi:Lon protease-like protein